MNIYENRKPKKYKLVENKYEPQNSNEIICKKIEKLLPYVSKKATNLISYPFNTLKFIDKLALNLKCNQWINLGSNYFGGLYEEIKQGNSLKPVGAWFSKGEWFFHDQISLVDKYITLIEVDYKKICLLTNFQEVENFIDKYGVKDLTKGLIVINWKEVSKNYYGFCLIPGVGTEIFNPKYSLSKNIQRYAWVIGYDVSSLVIWDMTCVTKIKPILFTGDYLSKQKKIDEKFMNQITTVILSLAKYSGYLKT